MKKILLLIICVFITVSAFSLEGTVKEYKGKVEVLDGGSWKAVTEGTVIAEGTTISTGFNSFALIDLGKSTLEVKALTRMTLEELVDKNGVRETGLFLRVGKVRANVERSEASKQNFRIRSSVATAAVRGTTFEFDGFNLDVENGVVKFVSTTGDQQVIIAGEVSSILKEALTPTSPLAELIQDTELPVIFTQIIDENIPTEDIEDFIEEVIDSLDDFIPDDLPDDIIDELVDVPVTITPGWDNDPTDVTVTPTWPE